MGHHFASHFDTIHAGPMFHNFKIEANEKLQKLFRAVCYLDDQKSEHAAVTNGWMIQYIEYCKDLFERFGRVVHLYNGKNIESLIRFLDEGCPELLEFTRIEHKVLALLQLAGADCVMASGMGTDLNNPAIWEFVQKEKISQTKARRLLLAVDKRKDRFM